MSILIFINSNIPDYQVFADSVKVPIGDFSLNTFNSNINRIGFVWENNKRQIPFGSIPYEYEQTSEMLPDQPINNTTYYFTKEFVDYLAQFTDPITVDLITCSLVTPVFTSDLDQIKKLLPNVTFNYSVNLTGNAPQGDWIMESSGEDIKSIYFNDIINTYSHILAVPIRIDHAFIFYGSFGGALVSINGNSATYTCPTNAETWAGFANINTSYYPLKFANGGKIEFEAVVSSNVTIRFKFEKLPYPDVEPSFSMDSVTITPGILNYAINIPSQGVNTFSSFLLYVDTKDVPIQLSQVYLSDDPRPESLILKFSIPANSSTTITLPISSYGGINSTVTSIDWVDVINTNLTNTYTNSTNSPIIKTVSITGTIKQFGTGSNFTNPWTGANRLVEVVNFGNVGLISLAGAFNGATLLTAVPNDLPNSVTNISWMFYGASTFNQQIANWNFSSITNFYSFITNNGYSYLEYSNFLQTLAQNNTLSNNLIIGVTGKIRLNDTNTNTAYSILTQSVAYGGKGLIIYDGGSYTQTTIDNNGIDAIGVRIFKVDSSTNGTIIILQDNDIITDSGGLINSYTGNENYQVTFNIPNKKYNLVGNIDYESSLIDDPTDPNSYDYLKIFDNNNNLLFNSDQSTTSFSSQINISIGNISSIKIETKSDVNSNGAGFFLCLVPIIVPVSNLVRTGGDPIIQPLIGQKFALSPHIKYVNLLADYSKKIFINAQIEMLIESDFPKEIYWDSGFSKTTELTHIYSNSYYRRFFIYYDGESVEVEADTLNINKITTLNKIKMISINPKTGLKSISFDKTYPLLDSTKGIKLGFDNYLLTIISDINTDDRHHLELLNVKVFDMEQTSGALISKDRIIRISNLAGPELFEYNSNPFESYQITN